jgi:hypothetical protein
LRRSQDVYGCRSDGGVGTTEAKLGPGGSD